MDKVAIVKLLREIHPSDGYNKLSLADTKAAIENPNEAFKYHSERGTLFGFKQSFTAPHRAREIALLQENYVAGRVSFQEAKYLLLGMSVPEDLVGAILQS